MNINRQELFKTAGLLGAALLIAGYARHTIQNIWGWLNLSLVIVGAVLLLASVIVNYKAIIGFFTGRSAKLSANTAGLTLAVIALLVIANVLGYRHHKRIDVTTDQVNSLSDQTVKIVSGLQKDVKVISFARAENAELRDRMKEFRDLSRKLTYEFVDPQVKPEIAQQYNIRSVSDLTTIVASGSRQERVNEPNEQALVNALLKVTRDALKTICFIEGHGEKPLSSEQNGDSYSILERGLKGDNYEVKSINLVNNNKIPTECSVVVVGGPTKPLLEQEASLLSKFLDEGGKILVMVDPNIDIGMDALLKNWNIQLGNDRVVDISQFISGLGPAAPAVTNYGSHPATKDLQRVFTVFPLARSVKVADSSKADVSTTELLKTSENGWAKTDLKGEITQFEAGKDTKGPINIGVAASKKVGEKEARLVVIGDSDFAADGPIRLSGNPSFTLNTFNWLAQDEDLISIRPKAATNRSITMTEGQTALVKWLLLGLLPLAVVGTGVYVWWNRR